jgi:two-component system invasion response regulator UvrY
MVRVLVVDDHEAYRSVALEVVAATEGFELAAEADSGEAALAAAGEHAPELAIVDKRMPGMGGYEVARRLTEQHAAMVVVLASVEDPDPGRAASVGAAAAIHKRDLSPQLLRDIWAEHGS